MIRLLFALSLLKLVRPYYISPSTYQPFTTTPHEPDDDYQSSDVPYDTAFALKPMVYPMVYDIRDNGVKTNHKVEIVEMTEPITSTTEPTRTTFTAPWSLATEELAFLIWDQAVVIERKNDLNADRVYPHNTSLENAPISPIAAATSMLRDFCDKKECPPDDYEKEGLGFQLGMLPGGNLIDGSLTTLCALWGSDETPTWVVLYLPKSYYVHHVVIHVSAIPGKEILDTNILLNQLLVSLEWYDLQEECDPVEVVETAQTNSNIKQLNSTCRGGIAHRVYLQVNRFSLESVPLNLTLAEIQVFGAPTGYHRHTSKSQMTNLNNTVVNLFFRLGTDSAWAETDRGKQGGKTRAFMLHTLGLYAKGKTHELVFRYVDGYVTVTLDQCGELERLKYRNASEIMIPCLADNNQPPCGWTVVFLEDTLQVYIESSLVGVFGKENERCGEDCEENSACSNVCDLCQELFNKTEAVSNKGHAFGVDTTKVWDTLKRPKRPSSKKERHDTCYKTEQTLARNCEFMILDVKILNKTEPLSLHHGYETFGVTDRLEEEFLEEQVDAIVGAIVDGVLEEHVEEHFLSVEFEREVQDAFEDHIIQPELLEVVDLFITNQLQNHREIFWALQNEQIQWQLRETELFELEFGISLLHDMDFAYYIDNEFSLLHEYTSKIFDVKANHWIQKPQGTRSANLQFRELEDSVPTDIKINPTKTAYPEGLREGSTEVRVVIELADLANEFFNLGGNPKILEDFYFDKIELSDFMLKKFK